MEFIIVFSVRSFVFEIFDVPLGNTRSSPVTGAVPPQLAGLDQYASEDPSHVLVAASTDLELTKNKNIAIEKIAKIFIE
ncbi:MAG: hypothetical protein KBB62_00880 [Candidatus Pacebacteria bacterium]|nr:hypothetical protein [Candidatus Paceibacterota bacterium]